MIGTGVFTSLGFQLIDIQSVPVLMALWLVGGLAAFCGAMCYAEISTVLPRSGGEYHFLTEMYHPIAGFTSGWVSITVGFAAPTALAAMTFGSYLSAIFPQLSSVWLATGLIVLLALMHSRSHHQSGGTQSIFTVLKLLLIFGFSITALALSTPAHTMSTLPEKGDGALLLSGAFAVSLIYVNYAYSGWNAATYISGELQDVQRALPRVLMASTSIVVVAYLALNYVFLVVAPMDALVGKVEVGYVAAQYAFGDVGATIMGVFMAFLLVSTVSAMILAGPRVLQRVGEDFALFRALAVCNSDGIPARAVMAQAIIALIFLWTASFDTVLVFSGATMALNTFFTVLGLFILRARGVSRAGAFRVSWYPLPPLVFLLITAWTFLYIVKQRPMEAIICGAIVFSGMAFFWLSRSLSRRLASQV